MIEPDDVIPGEMPRPSDSASWLPSGSTLQCQEDGVSPCKLAGLR